MFALLFLKVFEFLFYILYGIKKWCYSFYFAHLLLYSQALTVHRTCIYSLI